MTCKQRLEEDKGRKLLMGEHRSCCMCKNVFASVGAASMSWIGLYGWRCFDCGPTPLTLRPPDGLSAVTGRSVAQPSLSRPSAASCSPACSRDQRWL